eukprot:3006495-Rhodomonas_salina.1
MAEYEDQVSQKSTKSTELKAKVNSVRRLKAKVNDSLVLMAEYEDQVSFPMISQCRKCWWYTEGQIGLRMWKVWRGEGSREKGGLR